MTNAGWYPDPAGSPGAYRYWDGTAWSEQTSTDPFGHAGAGTVAPDQATVVPPPATPAPPAPPAPPATPAPPAPPANGGQPQYGAISTPPPPPANWAPTPGAPGGLGGPAKSGAGKTIAIVLVALVVLVALGLGAFFLIRGLTGDDESPSTRSPNSASPKDSPTGTPTDSPTSTDGATPSTSPTDGTQVTAQQCQGGQPNIGRIPKSKDRLFGGGLSAPKLADQGYQINSDYGAGFTFADAFVTIYKIIDPGDPDTGAGGWVSTGGVGSLHKANGFEDPEQAARVVMSCISQSPNLYHDVTSVDEVEAKSISVDGADAFSLTSDINIDVPEIDQDGDRVQVIVVDTGDAERFGVYLFAVPIGDDDLYAVLQENAADLHLNK